MRNKKNITMFGATGKIGQELLRFLSQAQMPTIAVTRDKSKAVAMPFIEWKEADMNNKDSLYHTMEDSRAVFLLSSNNEQIVAAQNNVIEVAKKQGDVHIVKLSSGAADKNSPFHIARVHGEIEELLKASGVPCTILRPNGFMQNWLGELAQTVKKERKIYEATGDGKRAYIDLRDIAEVAFTILTNPGQHTCHTYLLTSDEAVNYEQVSTAISNAIGENVTFISLTLEEAKQRMEQKGMPPWAVQTFLSYTEDQRNGKTAFISNDVQEILQKPARTVEAFAKEYAACFK